MPKSFAPKIDPLEDARAEFAAESENVAALVRLRDELRTRDASLDEVGRADSAVRMAAAAAGRAEQRLRSMLEASDRDRVLELADGFATTRAESVSMVRHAANEFADAFDRLLDALTLERSLIETTIAELETLQHLDIVSMHPNRRVAGQRIPLPLNPAVVVDRLVAACHASRPVDPVLDELFTGR